MGGVSIIFLTSPRKLNAMACKNKGGNTAAMQVLFDNYLRIDISTKRKFDNLNSLQGIKSVNNHLTASTIVIPV